YQACLTSSPTAPCNRHQARIHQAPERLSPRPIRILSLHALRRFHSRPIYLVIYKGSYSLVAMGNLILRGASRLDAFSAYPVHTWLSSRAPGGTTGTPAVCPSRSSRTRDRSSQISSARGR